MMRLFREGSLENLDELSLDIAADIEAAWLERRSTGRLIDAAAAGEDGAACGATSTRVRSAVCDTSVRSTMAILKTEIDPPAVGLDPARLARLDRHFQRYVDDGRLPGWLVAVARHGELAHLSTYGRRDVEAGLPVRPTRSGGLLDDQADHRGRRADLWEQGGFELNDPVRTYIPSFDGLRAWRSGSAVRPETESVTEEMRIWHLFTHTSGLTTASCRPTRSTPCTARPGSSGASRQGSTSPGSATASPSSRCCSSPAPSGTTA